MFTSRYFQTIASLKSAMQKLCNSEMKKKEVQSTLVRTACISYIASLTVKTKGCFDSNSGNVFDFPITKITLHL